MRTNIEIDDRLMADVMKETRMATKRAAVEEGLRLLLRKHRRQRILKQFGKVDWQGGTEDGDRS